MKTRVELKDDVTKKLGFFIENIPSQDGVRAHLHLQIEPGRYTGEAAAIGLSKAECRRLAKWLLKFAESDR